MVGTIEEIVQRIFQFDKNKRYEIKEYKEKRSISQNSYLWEIITQIANYERLNKEEVYFQMLKDFGQSEIVSILSEINPKGYFKYYEEIGRGFINGKEFTHYKIFKGSSEYDSKEMSILIDGVIQEARQLNIDTKPINEIRSMRII